MEKKYRVKLSAEEREELKARFPRGDTSIPHPAVGHEAQEGGAMKDEDIARSLQPCDGYAAAVWRRVWNEGATAAGGSGWTVTHLIAGSPRGGPVGRCNWPMDWWKGR